jgi:hypothetical protein
LDFGNDRRAITVTSLDVGGAPAVSVRDEDSGAIVTQFTPYDFRFTGGVRTGVGYFNADTIPDIVTGPGNGGGPHVKVYDGANGDLLTEFSAYDPAFRGGIYVAAGDVNADGIDEVITGVGLSGGPHVRVFDVVATRVLTEFMAYDPNFRGGVFVASGDANGDGRFEIFTGAGAGGGPHVKVYNGSDGRVLLDFFAYHPDFRGGVFVAAGDVNGDGRQDVLTGPGFGGGAHVQAFDAQTGATLLSFLAFTPPGGNLQGSQSATGARVAASDFNLDGREDVIVSLGRGTGPRVRVFDSEDLSLLAQFDATSPGFLGGVFVSSD